MSQWAEIRHPHLVEGIGKERLARRCSWTSRRSAALWSSRGHGCAAWTRGGNRSRRGWTGTNG